MADLNALLQKMVPFMGEVAAKNLADELRAIGVGGKEPWKKAVIGLASDAIAKHGHAGIELALAALSDIKNNKAPKLNWADLEVASDLLAVLQNAEADRKSAAHDFLVKLMAVLVPVLKIILSTLL